MPADGDAIARALAAVHFDPNLSAAAIYSPPGGGASTPIRVVQGYMEQDTAIGGGPVRHASLVLEVLRSALPSPAKEATITVGSENFRVFDLMLDDTRLAWRIFARVV